MFNGKLSRENFNQVYASYRNLNASEEVRSGNTPSSNRNVLNPEYEAGSSVILGLQRQFNKLTMGVSDISLYFSRMHYQMRTCQDVRIRVVELLKYRFEVTANNLVFETYHVGLLSQDDRNLIDSILNAC